MFNQTDDKSSLRRRQNTEASRRLRQRKQDYRTSVESKIKQADIENMRKYSLILELHTHRQQVMFERDTVLERICQLELDISEIVQK